MKYNISQFNIFYENALGNALSNVWCKLFGNDIKMIITV